VIIVNYSGESNFILFNKKARSLEPDDEIF